MRTYIIFVLLAVFLAACSAETNAPPVVVTAPDTQESTGIIGDVQEEEYESEEYEEYENGEYGETSVEAAPGRNQPLRESEEVTEKELAGTLKEFTIEMKRWEFNPDPITVNLGDTVRLTFTSTDVKHGVTIPVFGIQTRSLGPGDSETVEFVADQAGTFTFSCNTYCGSGHNGMRGTLIVE